MRRVLCILEVISIRELHHVVVAPAKEVTLLRDGQTVPITRRYFHDLLWYGYLLWSAVPYFEEWGNFLTILCALAALAESVITHCIDLALAVEHQ